MKKSKVAVIRIKDARPHDPNGTQVVFCLDGRPTAGGQTVIWADRIGESLYSSTAWIQQSVLDEGTDITEEFLSDIYSVVRLAKIAPEWLQAILEGRPEMLLPKKVVLALSGSSDKKLRLLAIKHFSRVSRSDDKISDSGVERGGQR